MRISEDRYARDLRRLHLAERLIRNEVRTGWICGCTGLSADRIRKLFHSYYQGSGRVVRPRGPSPTALSDFLRSLRTEASAIGGLALAMGAIPARAASRKPPVRSGIETGECFLEVFELFRKVAPRSEFDMDRFICLASALTKGEDLQIGHCRNCHGALLVDPLGARRRLCLPCTEDSLDQGGRRFRNPPTSANGGSSPSEADDGQPPYQQPLF